MSKQMTLGKKIILCVSALGTFLVLLTAVGFSGISDMDQRLMDAFRVQAKKLELMATLDTTGEAWLSVNAA